MFASPKVGCALVVLVCVATGPMMGSASAVTVEVAKKCDDLTAKAYPPRVPGNPAAGLLRGTAQSQRKYYRKCVANAGNVDDASHKEDKSSDHQ